MLPSLELRVLQFASETWSHWVAGKTWIGCAAVALRSALHWEALRIALVRENRLVVMDRCVIENESVSADDGCSRWPLQMTSGFQT